MRPPRPKLTPDHRAAILASLSTGKKPLQVAIETGASIASVIRIAREGKSTSLFLPTRS
jgi:hypothetical protein